MIMNKQVSCILKIIWMLKGSRVKVKTKHVTGVFLVFMLLCGFGQFFVPVTEGQQSSLVVDRAYWLSLASNAWKYFQPGVGVDSTTGLQVLVFGTLISLIVVED
jgi:hypothetical protein